jgi:hypothetical protein
LVQWQHLLSASSQLLQEKKGSQRLQYELYVFDKLI